MGKVILFGGGGSGVPVDEMTNPATASDVYSGNTFATKNSDELLTGNVQNKTTSHTQTLNETWKIPAGYHDGSGKVTQNLTYIGAQTGTIGANGSVAIKAGYHNGSGKITVNNPKYTGSAIYPGTSNTTLNTNGKVIDGKLYIPAQPNLTAANIVRGKSIFGVAGGFDTLAAMKRDQQVYNGSSFFGWMAGGVVLNPRGFGAFGIGNMWCNNESTNVIYPSGSLYLEKTDSSSSSGTFGREEEYAARLVSAKSIDFSQFSKIRVTGTYTATIKATGSYDGVRFGHPYIGLFLRFYEITNVSGTTSLKASGNRLKTSEIDTTDWKNPVTKTISFDLQDNISSWSENHGFLRLKVWNTGYDNTEGYYLYSKCVITGIWLYV